ncbi:MAG: hypothetical protein CMG57_09705 [Candidatus Marinimicrobia bacterium]|nr:hypothetical protein [Candidatus Neomarinimicrobiota bacterium]|tara:strand:+ start:4298 stop:5236 length:939 start_codon:yes stop_codon:yes gene_type:complete
MNYKINNDPIILIGTTSFSSISPLPYEVLDKKTDFNIIKANKRKFNLEELSEILPKCVGVIAGTELYDKSILSIANNLKVISRIGVGLDNVDLDYAANKKILVKITSTDLSASVAELTVSMILALYKNLEKNMINVRNRSFKKVPGKMLSDKIVGIVGLGRIGKATLSLLNGFNCKFLAHDKIYDEEFISTYGIEKSSLEDIFIKSDIICFHLSYTPELNHLISYDLLKKCSKSPIIINTSRGQIIDEKALIKALDLKLLSGIALDVYEKEPYDGPLCDRDDVLLTPHIASFTREVREKIEIEAVNNLLKNL